MFRSTLFKAADNFFKVPKSICGTLARPTETSKPKTTHYVVSSVPDKGEQHWTQSSPLFQIDQLQQVLAKREGDLPKSFTYRTLKATVHVTYRDSNEEENLNQNSITPKR